MYYLIQIQKIIFINIIIEHLYTLILSLLFKYNFNQQYEVIKHGF